LRDLFAAIFFVFFGLHTDPASIPPVLLPALALAVVTALTKIATGYWAARRAGISVGGRWRAGGALVARGEFSIVIAGLAVTAGIEPSLGPLATAYVLILVVLGPLTARYTQPLAERLTTRFGGRFGVTPERRDVAERPPEADAETEQKPETEPERAGEARQQTAVPD
jgi:CPA2 family monovalent cation:H+ antiporter-2